MADESSKPNIFFLIFKSNIGAQECLAFTNGVYGILVSSKINIPKYEGLPSTNLYILDEKVLRYFVNLMISRGFIEGNQSNDLSRRVVYTPSGFCLPYSIKKVRDFLLENGFGVN